MINIGVIVHCTPPASTSAYDNWKLYRASTKAGSYSVINGANGQAVTDLTYEDLDGTSTSWYKTSYYDTDASKESAKSDPFQGLSNAYTTVRKVEALMGIKTAWTDTTDPTVQQVAEIIARVEDIIDGKTGHAWRMRYSGTQTAQDQTQNYEYYDIPFQYEGQIGRPVYLKNRSIRTFSTTLGDILELWDGSNWVDWTTNRTEGRADDFWVDYEKGIVYIKYRFIAHTHQAFRIKYRFGEDYTSKLVEDIATKLAVIELLFRERAIVQYPETEGGSPSIMEQVRFWKRQCDENLDSIREFKTPGIMM